MKRNNGNGGGLGYLRKAFKLSITDAEIMQLVDNGHGGARPGAGATRKGRTRRFKVYLSPAEVEWLQATHGRHIGVALRALVLQDKGRR